MSCIFGVNICMKKCNEWTKDEIDYLIKNFHNTKNETLIPALGKTLHDFRITVKRLNLSKSKDFYRNETRGCKKYSFDTSFFKEIDTHEKAYWYGFIYADGSVSNGKFCLSLHEKDLEVLLKLKKRLKSSHPIKKNRQMKFLIISSEELREDLERLGIIKNKTNNFVTPSLPDKFLFSFVNGLFDGDGSIGPPTTFSICVHEKMAEWLVNNLSPFLNNMKVYNIKNKKVKIFKVMNKKDLFTLFSNMYKSKDFLIRKNEKFKAMLKAKKLI